MGAARFEIGLGDGRAPVVRHVWSVSHLLRAVAWLQQAHAGGADVVLRPAGEHGLVMVGGLDAAGLEHLARDGFAPAATVEVGPGRFEAWVKLSQAAVPPDVRRAAGAALAQRSHGHCPADGEPPFGHLAGFTPPASARDRARGSTSVSTRARVHDCHGRVAPAGAAYVAHIEQVLAAARPRGQPQPPERERQVTRDRG